jgi:hypothetical protein
MNVHEKLRVTRRERVALAGGFQLFDDFRAGGANDAEFGTVGGCGIGHAGLSRGEFVGFVVGFESAVFAEEGAFGGVFVAQHEVVHFDLLGGPLEGRKALGGFEEIVEMALISDAIPLGLGGAEDEIGFEGFGARFVGVFPAGEENLPAEFTVGGEDEGGGAGAVFEGVLGGAGAAGGGGGSCSAGVAFFGLGFGGRRRGGRFVEGRVVRGKHRNPETSVREGGAGFVKKGG